MIKRGFSVAGAVIGVLILAILGVFTFMIIDGNNKAVKYEEYDFNTIIGPSKDNGEIGDHVKGDPNAPVLIFEYADFQCPGCASINPRVNKIIEQLDGKLAVVYRNQLLSYHENGTAAASAAEAAGLQGYWKQYADKLFSEQLEWEYSKGSERTNLFNKYFEEVTEGKGDLEKFNNDIASAEISKKISFDMGIGKRIDVGGTPAFYIDGVLIDWGNKKGADITVNGKFIEWDSPRSGDNFNQLIKEIVEAKLSAPVGNGETRGSSGEDKTLKNGNNGSEGNSSAKESESGSATSGNSGEENTKTEDKSSSSNSDSSSGEKK